MAQTKVKEDMIVREGLERNNRTIIVDSEEDSDMVVWVSTRANTEKEVPPNRFDNVVLLDYADGCSAHQWAFPYQILNLLAYFKRSFVMRKNGVFERNCKRDESAKGINPYAYSGVQTMVNKHPEGERKYILTNVLRAHNAYWNVNRNRILNWTRTFVKDHDLEEQAFIGNIGKGGRKTGFDQQYLDHLANSKIIVTANPTEWEGDYRLWESLLSGALVFIDKMVVLDMMPYPYEHKKHLIFYDSTNQTEFNELLLYYIKHEEEARTIAMAGYRHTLDHHMAENRIDFLLSKVEHKL